MVGLRLLVLLCWAAPVFASVTTLKTSDKKDAPYVWNEQVVEIGKSDLTAYTKAKEKKAGYVNLHFRNIVPKLEEDKVLKLDIFDTSEFGMTFKDRAGDVWAYQPTKNEGTCEVYLLKEKSGVIKIWGKFHMLTPTKEDEGFCVDVEILPDSPLEAMPTSKK